MRTAVWIVLAVVALGGGALAYRRYQARPVEGPAYVTSPVDKGPIVAKVTATGTLSALVTVQVGAQVSGRIAELKADFNTPVTKGMVLARLDPELFKANLEQQQANVNAAKASLVQSKAKTKDAERLARRDRELAAQKLVAQADLDTAEANFEEGEAADVAAQASIDQALANLHQAQINLNYATVTSPITGVVISRSVDVGQTVAASLSAPTLFTIAEDLGEMQVDTNVAESDVGKLEPKQEATFTVDAFPGRTFKGVVRQIRNSASTVQNVVTYDAVIDVHNPDLKLRPGMTANVTFIWSQVDDALRVPNAALRYRPADAPAHGGHGHLDGGGGAWASNHGGSGGDGHHERGSGDPGHRTVWVLRDQKPAPVRVEVGLTDNSLTQIKSGELSEGDLVITDGPPSEGSAKSGTPNGPGGNNQFGGMRRMF